MDSDAEHSGMDAAHDYEFKGTFKGGEGRFGSVYTNAGEEAWLPKLNDLDKEAYGYGARIAFDTDKEFSKDISFSPIPKIVRAKILERDYEYDEVGVVAYTHKDRLFISIENREEEVDIHQKYSGMVKTLNSGMR